MKEFTESMRYEYPLNKDSVVLDFGAYEGNFTLILARKFGCKIFAFEPVPEFYFNVASRLKEFPSVTVCNFGVAGSQRTMDMKIKGDMTGAFNGEGKDVSVFLCGIIDTLKAIEASKFDLVKFNIEGLEYECLEAMLDADVVNLCVNLQIQFHTVAPDYEERREAIRSRLSKTHVLTYDAPFIWENWSLKT